MHEDALRQVLLVRAIEEEDATGALLPEADRNAAARAAAREAKGDRNRLLAARASQLAPKLLARHPILGKVLGLLRRLTWMHLAAIVLGLAAGVALSALDGTRYVNLLSLPLQFLLLWNVLVVVLVLASLARRREGSSGWLRDAVTWGVERFGAVLSRAPAATAGRVDATLAGALRRCLPQIIAASHPRIAASVGAALHLAAAAVGIGFIAGLLVRGLVLEYRAGWESTFLDPAQARTWMHAIHGLGSWAIALPFPDVAQVAALRWRDGVGGENAAAWIARMAATVAVVVVVPRLLLAALALLRSARRRARAPLPDGLDAYLHRVFRDDDTILPPRRVVIVPYAYAPAYDAFERLRERLREALGTKSDLRTLEAVAYGDEDRVIAALQADGRPVDLVVVAMSLASTPEAENHGRVLAAARERATTELVLDEAPFAQRMAGAPERLAERRAAWERFAAEHGVTLRILRSDA